MKLAVVYVVFTLLAVIECLPIPAAALPILSYGDHDQLRADHPLTASELNEYHRAKILNVLPGAHADLFDKPGNFSKLKVVTLNNSANEHLLEALARNHANIGALSLKQTSVLSVKEASRLRNFKNLSSLELHCTVPESICLNQYLPSNLRALWISNACPLPRLAKLTRLTVAEGSISADFLTHLDAPNLTDLNLALASVDQDALISLNRLIHLSYLSLPSTFRDQRDRISRLTSARIYIRGDGYEFH